jgi:hypothetical protein
MGEDGADEVAVCCVDGVEGVAAVPEAVVGGLVAEDEDETDDDGEGGDLESYRVSFDTVRSYDQRDGRVLIRLWAVGRDCHRRIYPDRRPAP